MSHLLLIDLLLHRLLLELDWLSILDLSWLRLLVLVLDLTRLLVLNLLCLSRLFRIGDLSLVFLVVQELLTLDFIFSESLFLDTLGDAADGDDNTNAAKEREQDVK